MSLSFNSNDEHRSGNVVVYDYFMCVAGAVSLVISSGHFIARRRWSIGQRLGRRNERSRPCATNNLSLPMRPDQRPLDATCFPGDKALGDQLKWLRTHVVL